MSTVLLDVKDASIAFGGLKAVDGFSLDLPEGSLQGLIGPNGAGKTTVFNLLTGVYQADRGSIALAGRSLRGLRPYQIAAEAMGVHTTRLKVTAFVLAAFFAGIAGALFAHEVGTTLNPGELGFQKSFDIVIMVVLGGMGSISGSALAALLLTVLPELLREFSEYRMIVYALMLVVMMLVRPQGIFGLKEIWDYEPLKGLLQRFR